MTIENIEVRGGEVNYVEQTVLLSENTTDNGISKVSGKIVDALTGNGLSNVTLELYSGWGTMQGSVVTTITSDEAGNYEIALERGYYTVKAIKDEYITVYKNVISFTNIIRANKILQLLLYC